MLKFSKLRYIFLIFIFAFLNSCEENRRENKNINTSAILIDAKGNPIPLNEDKIIIVNFLSFSCVSCMKELPTFKKVLNEPKYKGKFQFIGLALDNSTGDFSDKEFPIYPNNNRNFVRFRVNGTPTTYIILPNGKKLVVIYGAVTEESLRKFLDEALEKAKNYKN
jgi:thiol-disulfide isomerase/thioredoxin